MDPCKFKATQVYNKTLSQNKYKQSFSQKYQIKNVRTYMLELWDTIKQILKYDSYASSRETTEVLKAD